MFTSDQLRLLRLSRNMKQEFVAAKMGVTKQYYSRLENSNAIPQQRMQEILTILGYTMASAQQYLQSIPPEVF